MASATVERAQSALRGDRLVAGEAAAGAGIVKHPQQGAQDVQGGAPQVLGPLCWRGCVFRRSQARA